MMNDAADDPIPLHLSKLLNQHLLGHPGDRAPHSEKHVGRATADLNRSGSDARFSSSLLARPIVRLAGGRTH